jgi:hypothetical protein
MSNGLEPGAVWVQISREDRQTELARAVVLNVDAKWIRLRFTEDLALAGKRKGTPFQISLERLQAAGWEWLELREALIEDRKQRQR